MADQNQVNLTLQVQTAQALQSLQAFQKTAGETLQAVQEGTSQLSNAFGFMKGAIETAIAAFAIDKVKDFFQSSIDLAAEQETQITRLAAAMAQTGEYSEQAVQGMTDFADQMQKTTQFSENAILTQLAYAKGLGLSNEQSEKLVKVSADLAVATGEDLGASVEKLSKTYSGTISRMGYMFPVLKTLTQEQLESGEAVEILGKRLEGLAGAQLETYAGSVAQTSHAFDDFRKAVGGIFTDDPAVIAVIKSLGKAFEDLSGWVKTNKTTLTDYLNTGIEVIAVTVPSVIELFGDFVAVLEKVDLAFELVGAGAVDLTNLVAEGVIAVFQSATDKILDGVQALLDLAGSIPGVSDVLAKMGIDAGSASEAVGDLRDTLHDAADTGMRRLEQASKDAYQSIQDTVDFTDKVDSAIKGAADAADKVAQSYFNAAESAKKAKKSLQNQDGGPRVGPAPGDLQAAIDEWDNYYSKTVVLGMSASEKMEQEYQDQYDKIGQMQADLAAQGIDVSTEAEEQRQALFEHYEDLREKANEKDFEANQKRLQQLVQDAAKDPGTFILKNIGIDPEALASLTSDFSDAAKGGIGAAAGVLSDMLNGAKGAQDMISNLGGAFANALLPGIGPAVSSILTSLMAGPDVVKAQVEAFIKAIPDIMTAIGEAMPEIVDGFVDAMVNKGGAAKIGLATVQAMFGVPEMQQIGKDWGISFGDSLNSPNFSRTVHGWFSGVEASFGKLSAANFAKGIQGAGKELERIPGLISSEIFTKLPGQIRSGFDGALVDLRREVLAIPGELRSFFTSEVPRALAGSFGSVEDFFKTQVGGFLKAGGDEIGASVRNTFGLIEKDFSQTFASVLNPIRQALASFHFPEIPTPAWLKEFENAVHNLTSFGGLGGGGGGGGNPVTNLFTKGHFASGLDLVPPGFPNDSYGPVSLQSGEGVLDAGTNSNVRQMAANYKSDQAETRAILAQLAALMSQPQLAPIQLKIGSDVLASAMLKLSRTNARVSA